MKKITVAGIVILVSVSTLFRGLYFTYETYGFLAALALLLVLYFFAKMRNDEPIHINKLFMIPSIGLVAANVISFVNAANPRENLGTLLLYTELLVLFIVLYDYFYEKKQQFIRYLMMPVLIAGFLSAVVGTIALTGKFDVWEVTTLGSRVGTTFQYANTAAIYFVICLIFTITLVNTEKSIILRALAAGMGNIFIYALFMTGSRGGYLVCILIIPVLHFLLPIEKWINSIICLITMVVPVFITLSGFNSAVVQASNFGATVSLAASFIIAAVSYSLLHLLLNLIIRGREVALPKFTRLVFGGVLLTCLILIIIFRENVIQMLPSVMAKRLNRLITEGFNDINILVRLYYDKDALKLIASSWLTGLGGSGWKAMYQSVQDYFYTAAFVHNHYFQIFVENGILGFLSFIVMVALSIAGCVYSYVNNRDVVVRTYTAGLLCGLVSLTGHAAADFDLSFVSMLLLLWMMFAASMTDMKATNVTADRLKGSIKTTAGKLILVVVGSALFSFYGMYFAGAYNENIAYKYDVKKDYKTAMFFYEEANRFDPANTSYSFELAKLYHYFGKKAADEESQTQWFEKALLASERSVRGNKHYPAYMKTQVNVYLDYGMPLQALDTAQELVKCQKYNSEVYELLAQSYIDAARCYENNGDSDKAIELLKKCIEIEKDPYLHRSVITRFDIGSDEKIASYEHSEKLAGYLAKAQSLLEKFK